MLNAVQHKKADTNYHAPALDVEKIAQNGVFGCRRGSGVGCYDETVRKTFVSWCAGGMDVYARAFDHDAGLWQPPRRLRRNHMHGTWDYHNYPTMITAPDGRLLLFYVRHTKKLYLLSPKQGHTLEGKWRRRTLSRDACCYPYPIVCGKDIYVFYSKNDDPSFPYRTLRYLKSSDSGRTWEEPRTVVDTGKQDPSRFEEVYQCGACYAPAAAGLPERIQLTWTMWGGPKGHAQQGKGVYYAYLSLEDGQLTGADGKRLGAVIDFASLQTHCLIDSAQPTDAVTHTCGGVFTSVLPEGAPLIAYGHRDPLTKTDSIVAAQYAAGVWQKTQLDTGAYLLKDLRLHPLRGAVELVYLKDGFLIVRQWRDGDWPVTSATELPLEGENDCVPWVNLIENSRPELQLLLSAIPMNKAHKDYSGRFPVYCFGRR